MTGIAQTLSDIKLIVTTDRRIWAVGGFLTLSVLVWLVTSPWREPEPEPAEGYVRIKIEEPDYQSLVTNVGKGFKQAATERREMREEVERASSKIQIDQQEIDWHVDSLVDKMNTVTDKLDKLANRVGETSIRKTEQESKVKARKSGPRKKIQLDSNGF